MSDKGKVYIVGTSMVTAIGATTGATTALVNAGISGIKETAFLNKKLNPIKMALVPEDVLPDVNPTIAKSTLSSRQLRLLRLAAAALTQLAPTLAAHEPLPLFLALPEDLPEHTTPLTGDFLAQLTLQSGIAFNAEDSCTAHIGRAGGLYAIDIVHRYFAKTGKDYALIGGVDSYFDPYLLAKLDAEDRLNVQGAVDGFFPGEGATFILLASERVKEQLQTPLVSLSVPGLDNEVGHRYSDIVYKGDGLARAVTSALNNATPNKVDCVWTSMIYDSFCSKEIAVALTRNHSHLAEHVKMHHPVDCFGDMGAAMGCALLAMVAEGAAKNHKNKHHLLCCSSDLLHRAALRVDIS